MPAPRSLLPHARAVENLCWRCTYHRRLTAIAAGRRFLTTTPSRTGAPSSAAATSPSPSSRLGGGYFLSNNLFERLEGIQFRPRTQKSGPAAAEPAASRSSTSPPQTVNHDLPHRRRQAAKRSASDSAQALSQPDDASSSIVSPSTKPPPPPEDGPKTIPPDASSLLANAAAKSPARSLRRSLSALLSLSKPRLTVLVVLSAMAPYALYPVPDFLSPTTAAALAGEGAPSLSPLTLLFLTTGTTLCSASANALNMMYEPSTDALMSRTRGRPLVRGLISTRAALLFAVACAVAGGAALHFGVNPTVSFLGLANIVLYAGVYTPMKRFSAANTWVGALVGGIPPLMGWAAAAGESAVGDGSWRELLFAADGSSAGGWLFAALLFAWQFPHFMALSWGVREEYKAAGLRMMAWTNPARNARVALRYGLAFLPICIGLCAAGVTEWSFAVTSLPVNLWLARESVRFWRLGGAAGSARALFWASVWLLPVVMVLALLQKKGMWARVWRSVFGEDEDDEDDEEDEDEEDDDASNESWEFVNESRK